MSSLLEEPATTSTISPIIAQAVAFTKAYRDHLHVSPALREAMCLKTQYPSLLSDIRPGDLIAGRRPAARITYLGSIWWTGFPGSRPGARSEGKQGGYCYDFAAVEKYAKTDEERSLLTELAAFWEHEYTWSKVEPQWDPEVRAFSRGDGQISGGGCGCAVALDMDRLVQRGIPGLLADIAARRTQSKGSSEETAFLDGLRMAVEVLSDVCRHYESQALARADATTDAAERSRLRAMATALSGIVDHAPATFHEAIQLLWIYTLLSGNQHPESPRIDVALGDLFAHDVDSGTLTEDAATELIRGLWRMFNETGDDAVCRIVVGGIGRRNEKNANRFAMAAMEATRRHHKVTPQLTLRIYRGQDPALFKKAFEVLGQNSIYPMIYNDDVVIPGVAKVLHVSLEEAQRYHPLGCGEYMLGGCTPSQLNVGWSVPKTVEAVLHNGNNSAGVPIGPKTGDLASLDTFEKLYAAFIQQCEFTASVGARIYKYSLDTLPKYCAYLYASLLTDDCLARGRAFLDGGVRYTGACIMGHGFTNAADSLTAIRKLVYQEKRLTLPQLVAALDANFEGHESVRKMLLEIPKFGNDDETADLMLTNMWRDMNVAVDKAGLDVGFHFLSISSVNPGGYWMGANCGATADGRLKGENFAIGHAPTAGSDRKGLTALINSAVRVDPVNGGATTNFKLSPDWFTGPTPKAQSVFGVYFAKGGIHATITVVNRADLQAALVEPEKYPHVLVRLGGWSARFIDLEKRVQLEILNRTQY